MLREVLSCKNVFRELTMNGDERRRRVVAAQGLAALALFLFAHGAHAATPVTHADQGMRGSAAAAQMRP
jgi:predicted lipoprotein